MRHTFIPLAFGLGASATALQQQRYAECTLGVDTQDVGNARLVSSFEATSLVLEPESGILTDTKGRSCAWDKAGKLDCNGGYSGDKGWKWEQGQLKHEGSTKFAACPCKNNKEWDIYKYNPGQEHKCKPIHLKGHCGEPSPVLPYVPLGPKYDSCAKKCQPEKPSCFKSCEKKCQPAPLPTPKPCSKCKPWNRGCKSNCQPAPPPRQPVAVEKPEYQSPGHHYEHDNEQPHHQPPPPPPAPKAKCCTECGKWDGECFKTCYPPSAEDARIEYWKPHPVPQYHPRPQPSAPVAPVVPCHKCHPKKPECNKSCKPSPCHKCRPEHKGCKKTCQKPPHISPPYPWVKPWPKCGPSPKPFPTICDKCKPKEPSCQKSCISHAGVQRFIDAWEADVTPDVAERLSNEEMFEKVQQHLENATSEESAENEPAVETEAEDAQIIEKRDEPVSRVEADELIENIENIDLADQCRCPEKDHKCFKQCQFEEAPKKVVSCSDCKKPGCPAAKKCQHVKPKPCNVCNKDNKCQKTCFKQARPAPKPSCAKPCTKCEEKKKSCSHCNRPSSPKPSFEKPSFEKPSFEKPCIKCEEKKKPCNHDNKPFPTKPSCEKPCNKCEQAQKPCNHCNKPFPPPPAPKPVPCWECAKGEVECYKSCFIPKHHDQPKPFCCNSCHKENKSCFDRCDKSCKPYPPPPAPPKPPVVSCDRCAHKDFGCLETCFVKPEVYQTKNPDEKTKCCLEGCKSDDWACQDKCWAAQHRKYNSPHGKPAQHKGEHHGPPQGSHGKEGEIHNAPPVAQGHQDKEGEIHNGPPGAEFPQGYKPVMPEIPAGFKPVTSAKPQGYAPSKPAGSSPVASTSSALTSKMSSSTVHPTVKSSSAAPPPKATSSSKSVAAPVASTSAPATSASASATSTSAPATSTSAPATSAPAPVACTTAPVASAPAPVVYKPVTVKPYSGQSFGGCPANTNGDHQFPASQQSIPVDPQTKLPSSDAQINPTTSTVFTFSIPASWTGKTCSVYFAFPKPSDHKYNNKGTLSFDVTAKPGNGTNAAVQKYTHVNDVQLNGGATYWVGDHACTAGEISFEVSSKGGLDLSFPKHKGVGPFVRAC